MTAIAAPRTGRLPRPKPRSPSRDRPGGDRTALRSVPARSKRSARSTRRRGLVRLVAFVGFVSLFSAVAFHVVMAQRGFELERLRAEIDVGQLHYERLRLEVAGLSSPERIEAEATDRLGMVRPDTVTYLEAPLTPLEPTDDAAPSSTLADQEQWAEVKPHLDAQP